ncbi:MAG: polymer-forming cytoskeletal protein [candidate division NC10 bacterium]|jgi:cytoskeletal protein CcmA (bactofilin family)
MLKWTGSQKHDARSELPNADIEPPILTVMGKDAKLEGKIETEGSIQIECEVSGEMKVRRKLVIAQSGSVRADVQTADVTIHGEYEGNMVATGSVEITPTGRVDGNIETNSIIISKGGMFNGNVAKLKESEAEEGKPPIQLVKEKRVAKEN